MQTGDTQAHAQQETGIMTISTNSYTKGERHAHTHTFTYTHAQVHKVR